MVTSSNNDYDYYYSSSSSEEDSKTYVAKARAKKDHVKEMKQNMPLNDRKVTHDELLKRKAEDEALADYRQRRDRFQRRQLAAEEKLRSCTDDVASDASEDEPVWVPRERKIKPHRRTREIERLVEADLEAERKEEEYWDMMYSDPDERPYFLDGPNSDSEEEPDEDSLKDNNDDESDNSDKYDDSDESDASND
ncbi:ribosomal L1 domain-containing protein CG13096-like [Papaver somniferum]|uniref:ribosomal L1 domain-containing protein CG13096-like n=1 Tax=Papaver somniferum TaxID=3469 RepID=UPI000E6FDF61|nr:ribosomal L1 domain-containing protein CG13096-like [Papaver somniferum]